MTLQNHLKKPLFLLIAVTLMTTCLLVSVAPKVNAATPFTKAFLRLDSLTATTYTTARVCFRPTTTTAIHSIVVVFPTTGGTDYVIDSTASDWGLDNTNMDSGQTGVTNLPSAPTVSGKTVTVTLSSDLTPSISNTYCFNFNKQAGTGIIKTSSAGASETTQGTITTKDASTVVINQTTYSESIISSNSIAVSAIVPPSFTFAINSTAGDSFTSNLSTGGINTTGTTANWITITTNAASGWIVWAQDTNYQTTTDSGSSPANRHGALKSTTAGSYTISNNTSNSLGTTHHLFAAGSEDYGLGVTIKTDASGGGTVTADTAYDGSTSNHGGVLDQTRFRPIASANGTANGDQIYIYELATIAGQTPAASDYSDTINYVAAGQF